MRGSMVRSSVFVLVTLALLAGGFFAGRLLAGSKAVQAQSGPDPVSPASVDAVESFNCLNVANVAAYDNRIHVRCLTSPGDNVWFFAYPIGGANGYTASRMLAVAQTALALGERVYIYYRLSSDSNPPGCDPGDCRLMTGISMVTW
ncbi:MAG: hypothetical protein PVH95_02585 [Anaerolineae bacterium]